MLQVRISYSAVRVRISGTNYGFEDCIATESMPNLKHVCFAVPGVFPMLRGFGPYGGSELRAWRFAKHLAAKEMCSVSMIAFDYGQGRKLIRDTVIFCRDDGRVQTRGLWPRLRSKVLRVLGRASAQGMDFPAWESRAWAAESADLYISFGVTGYSAKLARWCAASGRRLVIMLGSDMDLDPSEPGARALYDQPCLLVAQTGYQRQEVRRRYGRDADLLPNPVAISVGQLNPGPREFALWVGKSDHIKCPDRMIQLALLCNEIPVTMIMNRADGVLFDAIKAQAPPNVRIIEAVEPERMPDYYRRAFSLVSTSRIEGFANSFLEAGASGTPVLSMNVDPNGLITVHGGGILANDLPMTAAELTRLYEARHWQPESLARKLGVASFKYVSAHHESGLIMARFVGLIESQLEIVT
jgi:glycosyltransferase involved in cell wall biosynthesis